MGLTVGEAQAVSDLLGFLFAVPSPTGRPRDPVRALNSAEFLATQAGQAQPADIRVEDIQAGWQRLERFVELLTAGHDPAQTLRAAALYRAAAQESVALLEATMREADRSSTAIVAAHHEIKELRRAGLLSRQTASRLRAALTPGGGR
ncbi:hypothetical protein [Streptosporangium sp. CA-115845]|uniref:hypothetical protein n=1 Tax=Streptosporangium sp. CA-115845 TaxID=3240071 RepID=UPI003D8EE4B6